MPEIQVEMYEVQLGAAVLLQFQHENGPVRVLADAGIHAVGYSRDHVVKKLKPSFRAFANSAEDKIDLLLGTHYDKDHLDGLIDVANDTSIEITEAWLPPVQDDTEGGDNATNSFLGAKFAAENGDAAYKGYIEFQRRICDASQEVCDQIRESSPAAMRTRASVELPSWRTDADTQSVEAYFIGQVEAAVADLPETSGLRQADDDVDELEMPDDMLILAAQSRARTLDPNFPLISAITPRDRIENLFRDPVLATNMMLRAAVIRKSAARNAINATSLKKLVDSLNVRRIPIRFEHIVHGQPKFCIFNSGRRFRTVTKSQYEQSVHPKLTLLGPSDILIAKHKKILPIFNVTMNMMVTIPIKSITASNQLSYVAKFEHSDQNILISGDTGFVDFKPAGNHPYFSTMLDSLDSLEVVQVAHHAGNNAHFYRVLQNAPFGNRVNAAPFLMLSHAVHDTKRPSAVFDSFVANLVSAGLSPVLLFTSEPTANKVRNVKHLVGPLIGVPSKVGDVKLTFDGSDWSVDAHSIQV